jgi:hypothetical protein
MNRQIHAVNLATEQQVVEGADGFGARLEMAANECGGNHPWLPVRAASCRPELASDGL